MTKQIIKQIVILHQGIEGSRDPIIVNAVDVTQNVAGAVRELGYRVNPIFLDEEFEWAQKLVGLRKEGVVDLVFNLADLGFGYDNALEPNISAVLEGLRVPFTGSSGYAMAFSSDKYASKKYLEGFGIPVPKCALANQVGGLEKELPAGLEYPVIVKKRRVHNSVGLTVDSVNYDVQGLARSLGKLRGAREDLKEWILEEYIESEGITEVCAGYIGNNPRRVLPSVHFNFGESFLGRPKIRDFDAKWDEEGITCQQSAAEFVELPKDLQQRLAEYTIKIADVFDIRDYGRFDFRLKRERDGSLVPYSIDINANPDTNTCASLFKMAKCAGYSYSSFIEAIMKSAFERYEK